jgi:membrane-bound lytic murein transglycosylase B
MTDFTFRSACLALATTLLMGALPGLLPDRLPGGEAEAAAPRRTQPRSPQQPPDTPPYGLREDVRAYMRTLSEQEPQLDAAWLEATVGQARHIPQVTRLIMPAASPAAKNWSAYRDRFIEPRRIDAGLAFWNRHAAALQAAEARWGVPAELVVGIIGVETFYGQITGNFRVLDALATLAFDFPSGRSDRSGFFRDELTSLLRLARREGLDLRELRGSYAGAIGWGQFMPSSWTQYGVDFDGDGRVALHRSEVDAIGSVAHYLAAFGWQKGLPTHRPVQPPTDPQALARLLEPDIRPSFTAARLAELGVGLDAADLALSPPLALVELRNGVDAPPQYWIGTQNFWVVTRYNWSAYYAMAVIELAEAVARQRQTQAALVQGETAAPAAAAAPAPSAAAR